MYQVYEILINKTHYYNGIVNEMTGDGVLALFGVPKALKKTAVSTPCSSGRMRFNKLLV